MRRRRTPRVDAQAMLKQAATTLAVDTRGRGLIEITPRVRGWLAAQSIRDGVLTAFCRHTSASLLIQENAAPEVLEDTEAFFARLAPESESAYAHDDEGPDDMPAHLRMALTGVSLSIPLASGALALGTWQGIFVFEHRRRPHRREIALALIGA